MDHQTSPASEGQSQRAEDDSSPACQSCRKRKMKCSRETPACSNCVRAGTKCLYVKKCKTGIKPGVLETLGRRIDHLEDLLEASDARETSQMPVHNHASSQCVKDMISILSIGLQKATEGNSTIRDAINIQAPSIARAHNHDGDTRKRRRLNDEFLNEELVTNMESPIDGGLLDEVIDVYFDVVHHWIPMIHKATFMRHHEGAQSEPRLTVILHAMLVSTLRFIDVSKYGLSPEDAERRMQSSRQQVLLQAMVDVTVENLQALSILAFDNLGSGKASEAWPLIGSLTRTVEYLQLSVEVEENERHPLLKPHLLSTKTSDWTTAEERRRVFWCVFLLDRFCSVCTGWNTSLTSNDVHRRLPCDGKFWNKVEPVKTPYFGIWDKAAGKIGKSVAFIPSYPSPDDRGDENEAFHHGAGHLGEIAQASVSTLGAFAYCVEATESLSQVITFFLQQRVNFMNKDEVGRWLTRFKELDLRLVQWKLFLPSKWKDGNISEESSLIVMDPNVTLAHITHNTSMIFLHHRIAYPPPNWNVAVKLPSVWSAQTCELAAFETTSIVKKYLDNAASSGIVSSQFMFCAYISGRVHLVHWRSFGGELPSEFTILLNCLKEMASRWSGRINGSHPNQPPSYNESIGDDREINLAHRFYLKLEALYRKCTEDSAFWMDLLDYTNDDLSLVYSQHRTDNVVVADHPIDPMLNIRNGSQSSEHMFVPSVSSNPGLETAQIHPSLHQTAQMISPPYPHAMLQQCSPPSSSNMYALNFGNVAMSSYHDSGASTFDYAAAGVNDANGGTEDVSSIIDAFLGQRFSDVDRVMSLNDTIYKMSAMQDYDENG